MRSWASLISILLIGVCLTTCNEKLSRRGDDFVEEVVDLAVRLKNNRPIELSTLYDSLATTLPADSVETLVLAEELKRKGFKVIDWGRGNFPPNGVRIVVLGLKKDSCYCSVSKMYYSTIRNDLYQIRESISCKDSVINR